MESAEYISTILVYALVTALILALLAERKRIIGFIRRRKTFVAGVVVLVTTSVVLMNAWQTAPHTSMDYFKQYVDSIAKKTNGWGYYELNITLKDAYNGDEYIIIISVDNNYCAPIYDGKLYYHGQLIAVYVHGLSEGDGKLIEWSKVYNQTILDKFVQHYLTGFDMNY